AGTAFTTGRASGPAAVLAKEMLQNLFVGKLKVSVAVLMLLGVVAGAGVLAQEFLLGWPVGVNPPTTEADAPKAVSVDRYGDPLPEGAVARLGTVRWRHLRWASGLVFSPDDKVLAAVCWNALIPWDATTGKELRRLPSGPLVRFGGPDFSPDGKTLALLQDSGEVCFWEVATGKRVRTVALPPAAGGGPYYHKLCFSSDGKVVAVTGDRDMVYLLDTVTSKVLHQLGGHRNTVSSFAFSPDGKTLALFPIKQGIQFWDVDSGKLVRSIECPNDEPILVPAFSP